MHCDFAFFVLHFTLFCVLIESKRYDNLLLLIMIIGLSGTLSAGKDTVAEYLVNQKGFDHVSLSEILRGIARERNIEPNMVNLTKLGNSLINTHGEGYLVDKASEKVDFDRNLVISSVRQPAEIDKIKSRPNSYVVFVDADAKIRFERLRARGRTGDSETLEEFTKLERKQSDGKSGGMNLNECKRKSDFVLENNGTREEFLARIENLFDKIG